MRGESVDDAEIDALRQSAGRRRTRAAIVISAALGVIVTALMIAPDHVGAHRAVLHCHHVDVRYENAPENPGLGWESCAER